jgi:hypothetical protein
MPKLTACIITPACPRLPAIYGIFDGCTRTYAGIGTSAGYKAFPLLGHLASHYRIGMGIYDFCSLPDSSARCRPKKLYPGRFSSSVYSNSANAKRPFLPYLSSMHGQANMPLSDRTMTIQCAVFEQPLH